MYRATAIGVWRVIILAGAYFPKGPNPDPTYSIGYSSSAIEANVAVITACGPSFKAISTRYLPRLLGSSGKQTYYGRNTSGSHKFPGARFFSNNRASQLQSNGDDGYEMADPNRGHRVNVSSGEFDMRKYRRGGDSPSISSGSEEGVAGIVKTTDVSVRYTVDEIQASSESRSREGRQASVDSLV